MEEVDRAAADQSMLEHRRVRAAKSLADTGASRQPVDMSVPTPTNLTAACAGPVPPSLLKTCVEVRSADATEAAASSAMLQTVIASASLLLTIAGTIALIRTLGLTRKATDASVLAAKEAQLANRRAAEALRPQLLMKSWKTRRHYDVATEADSRPDGQLYRIEWVNSGAVIAILRRRGEQGVLVRKGEPDPDFSEIVIHEAPGAIAPGGIFVSHETRLTWAEWLEVGRGDAVYLVRYVAEYAHPTSGTEYRSAFTMRYRADGQVRTDDGSALISNGIGEQYSNNFDFS